MSEENVKKEPELESKDVLSKKVVSLQKAFKALLEDHSVPILRQNDYVHTGAYALEALINALSGTALQVCRRYDLYQRLRSRY
jgi:hypothetical protein